MFHGASVYGMVSAFNNCLHFEPLSYCQYTLLEDKMEKRLKHPLRFKTVPHSWSVNNTGSYGEPGLISSSPRGRGFVWPENVLLLFCIILALTLRLALLTDLLKTKECNCFKLFYCKRTGINTNTHDVKLSILVSTSSQSSTMFTHSVLAFLLQAQCTLPSTALPWITGPGSTPEPSYQVMPSFSSRCFVASPWSFESLLTEIETTLYQVTTVWGAPVQSNFHSVLITLSVRWLFNSIEIFSHFTGYGS